MSDNESIKDTLDVIRRALEDENDFSKNNENVLLLVYLLWIHYLP